MKHKAWLLIGLIVLLVAAGGLILLLRPRQPGAGETPPPGVAASPTSTATPTPTFVAASASLTPPPVPPEWGDLPTVTPPAPGEPTVPAEALAMRVAPSATPGNPPPLPTATPTVTPYPTPQPIPVGGQDDVKIIEIPAGDFLMGTPYEEAKRRTVDWLSIQQASLKTYMDEAPQLLVYVDTFFIDQVEVTNIRYQRCVDAGVCAAVHQLPVSFNLPGYATDPRYAEYPAMDVTWEGAYAYCQWIGKRLPTEAEWEKAARGTDGRWFSWGNEGTPENSTIVEQPKVVGSFPAGASPYGVLDMVGNAPEWTADRYQAYPSTLNQNQGGTNNAPYVIRGINSWTHQIWVTQRIPGKGDDVDAVGFRCVQGPSPVILAESVVRILDPVYHLTPTTTVDLSMMAYIPAGEFLMGVDVITDENRIRDHSDEQPQHIVYLDAFYIDRYPVTYAQYADFLNVLSAHRRACGGEDCTTGVAVSSTIPSLLHSEGQYYVTPGYQDYAVDGITWSGAQTYCAWQGKRLPTDAEWEKAARGTDGRRYPWGNEWDARSRENDNFFVTTQPDRAA